MNHETLAVHECFHTDHPEIWNRFLERFDATKRHICYYPSANNDFRPLIYQQIAALEELRNRANPAWNAQQYDYAKPDLWIFSDYGAGEFCTILETNTLHSDDRATVSVQERTRIHANGQMLEIRLNANYINMPISCSFGQAYYLRLRVSNQVIGDMDIDAIYFLYENVNLIDQFILRHKIPISHLVWVNDGAGFGGGQLRHSFLMPLLPLLQTRWIFIWEFYYCPNLGNYNGIEWPQELCRYLQLCRYLPIMHEIGRFQAGKEKVVFCELEKTKVVTHLCQGMSPEEEANKAIGKENEKLGNMLNELL